MKENVIPNVARIDIDNVDFAAAQIAGALVIRHHARDKCLPSRGMKDPPPCDGPALRVLGSPPVTQWVRLLSRVTGASAEWHAPQTKSFTTTTYCGTKLEGSLEVTSEEKAEREGRCSSCVTHLAATLGLVEQGPSRPTARAPRTPVARAAAKKTTAKKTIRTSPPKGRSGKAPVAKRPVRRSRRGRA
jgi:hypothetical protein